MFGIYLNGYWDKEGYHSVDAGDTTYTPKLIGLFPFGEEALAFASILEQDDTSDWRGDYEVSVYEPPSRPGRRKNELHHESEHH